MRALLAAAAVALAGCGSPYNIGGPCTGDADCRLCAVCDCLQPYSVRDLNGASCAQVARDASCPKLPRQSCLSGSAYQALCVSGFCQAVQR